MFWKKSNYFSRKRGKRETFEEGERTYFGRCLLLQGESNPLVGGGKSSQSLTERGEKGEAMLFVEGISGSGGGGIELGREGGRTGVVPSILEGRRKCVHH